MIVRPAHKSDAQFREWVGIFAEKLFVNLVVYTDESGTNDPTGTQPGSQIATFGGWLGAANYWCQFRGRWIQMLNRFRAKSFHFRDYASKHLCSKSTSQYFGWSKDKRHRFLYDAAMLAAETAIPIGGLYDVKANFIQKLPHDPYQAAFEMFFVSLREALDCYFPNTQDQVLVIVDSHESEGWRNKLAEVHDHYQKRDSRIGGLQFQPDNEREYVPLQASDLYAYMCRQYAERTKKEGKAPPLRALDLILYKNTPGSAMACLPPELWRPRMQQMIQHEVQMKRQWERQGDAKRVYYPDRDWPFLVELMKKHPLK